MELLTIFFYILFVLAAIVLIVVILLQEGRGGGFGQALGEGGQQTFGVGAKGINTFTGYTALVFLVSAIVIHVLTLKVEGGTVLERAPSVTSPLPGGPLDMGAPAGGGQGGDGAGG